MKPAVGLALLLLGLAGVLAAGPGWRQERSRDGGIVVETPDANLSESLLEVTQALREKLKAGFGLVASPTSRLLLRVEDLGYQADGLGARLSARREPDSLQLQVTAFRQPTGYGEDFLRQTLQAMVYQHIYRENLPPEREQVLAEIPLWLTEGLLQSTLGGGQREQNTRILQRARLLQRAPPLALVLGWKELGHDRLERAWQQAFCFHVLQFAQMDPERWEMLRAWLSERALSGEALGSPWVVDEALESVWQASLADPRLVRGPLIYSWERSAAELAAAQSLYLPAQGGEEEVLTSLHEALRHRAHPGFQQAVVDKQAQLTLLEMRADFSWRPVVQIYRAAAAALLDPRQVAQYPALLQKAEQRAQDLNGYNQRVNDYLSWFEVTQAMSIRETAFASYFRLTQEITAFQTRLRREIDAEMIQIERKM